MNFPTLPAMPPMKKTHSVMPLENPETEEKDPRFIVGCHELAKRFIGRYSSSTQTIALSQVAFELQAD